MEQEREIEYISTYIRNLNDKLESLENDSKDDTIVRKMKYILEHECFPDDERIVPQLAQALRNFMRHSTHVNVLLKDLNDSSGLIILRQDFNLIFEFSKAKKDCTFYSAYAQAMTEVFSFLISDPDLVSCAKDLASLYNEIICNVGDLSSVEVPFYFLCQLVDALSICGDYEHQYILLNLITLLIHNGQYTRENLLNLFPESKKMLDELMNISTDNFAIKARKFLNLINEKSELVRSMLCLKIQMGEHLLISDNDNELWVDFNYSGQSISFYVKSTMLENRPVDSKCDNDMVLFRINEDIVKEVKKRAVRKNGQLHIYVNFHLTSAMLVSKSELERWADSKIVQFIFSVSNDELHMTLTALCNEKYIVESKDKLGSKKLTTTSPPNLLYSTLPIVRTVSMKSMRAKSLLEPAESADIGSVSSDDRAKISFIPIKEKCDLLTNKVCAMSPIIKTMAPMKAKGKSIAVKSMATRKIFLRSRDPQSKKIANIADSKKENSPVVFIFSESINENGNTPKEKGQKQTTLQEDTTVKEHNFSVSELPPGKTTSTPYEDKRSAGDHYGCNSPAASQTANTRCSDKVDRNSVYSNFSDRTCLTSVRGRQKSRKLYDPESPPINVPSLSSGVVPLPPSKIIKVISNIKIPLDDRRFSKAPDSGRNKRKLTDVMEVSSSESDIGSRSPLRKKKIAHSPQGDMNEVKSAQVHTESIVQQKILRKELAEHEDAIELFDDYIARTKPNVAGKPQQVTDTVDIEHPLGDVQDRENEEAPDAPRTLSIRNVKVKKSSVEKTKTKKVSKKSSALEPDADFRISGGQSIFSEGFNRVMSETLDRIVYKQYKKNAELHRKIVMERSQDIKEILHKRGEEEVDDGRRFIAEQCTIDQGFCICGLTQGEIFAKLSRKKSTVHTDRVKSLIAIVGPESFKVLHTRNVGPGEELIGTIFGKLHSYCHSL